MCRRKEPTVTLGAHGEDTGLAEKKIFVVVNGAHLIWQLGPHDVIVTASLPGAEPHAKFFIYWLRKGV